MLVKVALSREWFATMMKMSLENFHLPTANQPKKQNKLL